MAKSKTDPVVRRSEIEVFDASDMHRAFGLDVTVKQGNARTGYTVDEARELVEKLSRWLEAWEVDHG